MNWAHGSKVPISSRRLAVLKRSNILRIGDLMRRSNRPRIDQSHFDQVFQRFYTESDDKLRD